MPNLSFSECVNLQVKILEAGKPLEAFDRFFARDGVMYANDAIFASGAEEGRGKQEPFVSSATSISGLITNLKILEEQEICVFRNKSSFTAPDGERHQIDGLCWQKWDGGQITEERYYDGSRMQSLITDGILLRPDILNAAI